MRLRYSHQPLRAHTHTHTHTHTHRFQPLEITWDLSTIGGRSDDQAGVGVGVCVCARVSMRVRACSRERVRAGLYLCSRARREACPPSPAVARIRRAPPIARIYGGLRGVAPIHNVLPASGARPAGAAGAWDR